MSGCPEKGLLGYGCVREAHTCWLSWDAARHSGSRQENVKEEF